MINTNTAILIKEAIEKEVSVINVSLESIERLTPIDRLAKGYSVLGIQYGDLAILVRMKLDAAGKMIVKSVKTYAW